MQRFCWKEFSVFDGSGGANLYGSFPRELRLLDAIGNPSLTYLQGPGDLTLISQGFEKDKCAALSEELL